ncbi:hypothetical protein [Algibacter sp. L4_22]|uniref:hypothetical protein n=1 Tax=Algibacter sp. L4_22 TaxID=2942477 RepID=UPI00201B7160|nr:hypothetical protein [Algibacter sp. L4_22]MCL5128385.1 hypothetical protein [Algibacter sp. L4_22]
MRKYKIGLVITGISLMSCNSQIEKVDPLKVVTPKMVEEQESLCHSTYKIKQFETDITAYLDTTSVEEVKNQIKTNYEFYLNNKADIIDNFTAADKDENNHFKSLTKSYLPDEERFNTRENVFEKLVNNNHLSFRDSINKGVYFNQYFENNKSSIRAVTRYNGAAAFRYTENSSYRPYYPINFDSEEDLTIMDIFYYDGTQDNNAVAVDVHAFPLNAIPIETIKPIDSFKIEIKLKYLAKIDSVHFNKDEIGVQKGNIKLLKMEDNYVEYELPSDYYPYHKGTVLEEIFFNKEGNVLDTEFGISNCGNETPEESYVEYLDLKKEIYEYVYNAHTYEDLFLTFKYMDLKFKNQDDRSRKVNKKVLKGNVDSFTLYLENRRDTLTLLPTLKNIEPIKNVYVHELNDKTDFIDKKGKVIKSFPSEVSFIYNSKTQNYSDKYFYVKTEDYDRNIYYFLNQDNQWITELPYSRIDYVSPSIFTARLKNEEGLKLISTEKNQLLSEETFTNFIASRYTDDLLVTNDAGTFAIYDQDDKLVTLQTKQVKTITFKKSED